MRIVAPPTVPGASPAPSSPAAQADTGGPIARIGPNAIIQSVYVLRDRLGAGEADRLLRRATGYDLAHLPHEMVDEREPLALVRTVMDALGEPQATRVLREAGRHTADYLLAHRIPRPAQWIMRAAPRRVGLALLLRAMAANAWTFAGSATFTVVRARAVTTLSFHDCAMCRGIESAGPMCDFYAGTFEHLTRALVTPRAEVVEVECQAHGGRDCRFEVRGIH
ncbi:MAG: bacteriochlorophyll 4-vinyl reductase [Gemmatimonas sp.]|jgi:divinyl protochlorophyllide a 8-vinyl-reductase|uniref:bacteriochlorophyll 4-vinyl reductase n=1 Tax=Gemmatimonas sp. TaxID=1962908 RepID=UPI00391F30BB|nr:bacteriochlorophyll 4-vinyl reductase [Gemmatimonadota bacterium]